ncbi:hypothetical protein BGZ80_006487 [Entomortierella chlamydospora]|uniref:Uncharacterized protein n=1 Tax=Entomortierella chlamydospora TaxID=101097 RepID=A0A9P6N5N0_9FUNG|nr:hypothetical protein BGZ79_004487 [Entomortierella chlamydospora]KAG0024043.1 hypothetical protein BGZ80_006487 [Entomortierella chlamydospora]
MILKSSFAVLVVAALTVFSSYAPQAEAHSWADCIKWEFNKADSGDWSDNGGKCLGYARRFPLGKPFGSLDDADPNRNYEQDNKDPDHALPCSDGKAGTEPGSNETLANPTSAAYGGKWGQMTITNPAKNHAVSNEPNHMVQINLSNVRNGKDVSQQQLLQNTVAQLPFKNRNKGSNEDRRPCGGCFKVPARASGIYLLQRRWMLNQNEWYTLCADIQIGDN